MTTISATLPAYTPPPASTATAAPATLDSNDDNTAPASSTNADPNAPALYTALASASTSIIRGSNLNTTV